MLERLIIEGEGESVDFKQTISSEFKIAKTIVSFANSKGGKIIVGVKDNGIISGARIEEEKYMLNNAASFYCDPPIPIHFEEEEIDGKSVLVAEISESRQKPHFALDKTDHWNAYIRVKDKCLIASKEMINVMTQDDGKKKTPQKLSKAEKRVLDYLKNNERITLKEFAKLANISTSRAHKILVNLVQMQEIRILSHEKLDYYSL